MRFFKSHGFGKPPLREMLFRYFDVLGSDPHSSKKGPESIPSKYMGLVVPLERTFRSQIGDNTPAGSASVCLDSVAGNAVGEGQL